MLLNFTTQSVIKLDKNKRLKKDRNTTFLSDSYSAREKNSLTVDSTC